MTPDLSQHFVTVKICTKNSYIAHPLPAENLLIIIQYVRQHFHINNLKLKQAAFAVIILNVKHALI